MKTFPLKSIFWDRRINVISTKNERSYPLAVRAAPTEGGAEAEEDENGCERRPEPATDTKMRKTRKC